MIDTMDIYRTIKEVLEDNFKNIKVQMKDVKNPHPPCFYIKFITDNGLQTATEYETTDYAYAIIYFSKKETVEDLLSVSKRIKKILKKPLKIKAYDDAGDLNYVEVNNVNTTLDENNYILTITLNIEHTQELGIDRYESKNNEIAGEIQLNISSYK